MLQRNLFVVFFFLFPLSSAFFFGGGGGSGSGCGCSPSCGCSGGSKYGVGGNSYSYGGGGSGYGGSSYAQPQFNNAPFIGGSSYASGPATGGSSYASGPAVGMPSYASGPGVGESSYASGPSVGQSSYSAGPDVGSAEYLSGSTIAEPQPSYDSKPASPVAVQVPPSNSYGQGSITAGQILQEVQDDDEQQMIYEAKSEDDLNETIEGRETIKGNNAGTSLNTQLNVNGTIIEPIDVNKLNLIDNLECNSEDLQKILLDNINEDLNSAKRVIQLAAETKFGGRFDVICSNNDFSYVTNTELYCQETKQTVSCYAYRQI